jgi:hypothetical protein
VRNQSLTGADRDAGRAVPRAGVALLAGVLLAFPLLLPAGVEPDAPLEIGRQPQFFVDDAVVDNRWAIQYENGSKEMVLRVLHPPRKDERNPLLAPPLGPDPSLPQHGFGCVNVVRDASSNLFRMWYQWSVPVPDERQVYRSVVGYAESSDGLRWKTPALGVIDIGGSKQNNAVWAGATGKRADAPQIIELPEPARRGYRYVMLYLDGGLHVVGSHDGIHWDASSNVPISGMHSDTANTIVYDPARREYLMYCRARDRYRTRRGDVLDVGESRRVARMASSELWTEWKEAPRNILLPDELDAARGYTAFYGMSVQLHAGIYWGFLQLFRWNTEIAAELVWSRDGLRFDRLPDRPKVLEPGPGDAWDSGMVAAANQWVEVGDEWWLYYSGWDGPHGAEENRRRGRWRVGRIGLTRVRKEGFVSMRGPEHGGVIATRTLRWPDAELEVNADASRGELKVRVSDERRQVIPGFDFADCKAFRGDSIAHRVSWGARSMKELAGRVVRLEVFLKSADIFTFRAAGAVGARAGD